MTRANRRRRGSWWDDTGTDWTGWIGFAGVVIVITGRAHHVDRRIAVVNDQRAVDESGLLIPRRLPVGTAHIDVGRCLLDSGAGVFNDSVPARKGTVLLAAVSSIVTFSFTPAYPLWALVVVSIDVLVIWALTAHGKEVRRA